VGCRDVAVGTVEVRLVDRVFDVVVDFAAAWSTSSCQHRRNTGRRTISAKGKFVWIASKN